MTNPQHQISPAEIRQDYLTDRWVIFAPSRANRPDILTQGVDPKYDDSLNPFCSGQEFQTPGELYAIANLPRQKNTPGWDVRVFPNAFPALNQTGLPKLERREQFTSINAVGHHELIVDCPHFETDFGNLPPQQIAKVLTAYRDRMASAFNQPASKYVQIFKNQGAAAGASLPHAHSQLLTFPIIPPLVQAEIDGCIKFSQANSKQRFFSWLIDKEVEYNQRVILNSSDFMVLAPYASRFAYEAWVIPHEHVPDYSLISPYAIDRLSIVLSEIFQRLSQLIHPPSYNFVIHSLPVDHVSSEEYCWHLEILPRITGLAGFEMGTGCYVNTVFPEQAAKDYALD